jgi:nitrogen regulatory protein P-II 1
MQLKQKEFTWYYCILMQQSKLYAYKLVTYYTNQGLSIAVKKMEIIIPDRRLHDVSEILKDANTGGMSCYRIEGRGKIKAEAVSIGRGTMRYKPEFIPRTKVEVVVKDEQVEALIKTLREKLGDNIGGKIFVTDVAMVVDLTTGNREESAI